jgi:hypothetical protein
MDSQIPRLTENTKESLSGPFKVPEIARDGKGHGSREIGYALVFEECEKVGVGWWVEDDL